MKTVKSIKAAESFLRKLAGEPSTFVIRTIASSTVLPSGRIVCGTSSRITIATSDKIEVDSLNQPTLQRAFDAVSQAITTERTKRSSKRNSEAIQQIAKRRTEAQR